MHNHDVSQTPEWPRSLPEQVGIDPDALRAAKSWMDYVADGEPYRIAVLRHGRVAAQWCQDIDPHVRLPIASAAKSLYSNVLGIAIAEGRIPSADALVVDYYPEMMDVPPGRGPKEYRHAFPANAGITFRQLIGNTSGYMKPGEEPGRVFNYQTFGMNILTHAVAKVYGLYDSAETARLAGFAELIRTRIAEPIGADFGYSITNFPLGPDALINVFGNYTQVHASLHDLVRLGVLWLQRGSWNGTTVVPEDWLATSVRVNGDIRRNCHELVHRYGLGFWTNEAGQLYYHWDTIPRSAYMAAGAGGYYVVVLPEHDMVVVQAPGPARKAGHGNPGFLAALLRALRD
jgi:CubicO group peptidase (beta-lactamase class C family)